MTLGIVLKGWEWCWIMGKRSCMYKKHHCQFVPSSQNIFQNGMEVALYWNSFPSVRNFYWILPFSALCAIILNEKRGEKFVMGKYKPHFGKMAHEFDSSANLPEEIRLFHWCEHSNIRDNIGFSLMDLELANGKEKLGICNRFV